MIDKYKYMRKYLLLLVMLLTVTGMQAEMKTITYTRFSDGIMYESDGFDYGYGTEFDLIQDDILTLRSLEKFGKIYYVSIVAGASERYVEATDVFSSVYIWCGGATYQMRVQRYAPLSNISTDNYTLKELNMDGGPLEIQFVIQGFAGLIIDYIEVGYEPLDESEKYDLWIGENQVTSNNRLDVLEDGGSVQFDGQKMLVLNNAKDIPAVDCRIPDLCVYLKGESSIVAGSTSCISFKNTLTFTTEGNTPGSLDLTCSPQTVPLNDIAHITFEQNLQYAMIEQGSSANKARIAVPFNPIVDESNTARDVPITDNEDLYNQIYDDVLYTLTSEDGNHFDPTTETLILGSTMCDVDVENIISTYQPGTAEFAEHFAGITFMVPAGTGKIFVTAMTGEWEDNGELCVQVGSQDTYHIFSGVTELMRFDFDYNCEHATYVYVYSNSPIMEASALADHRAGKKTTVTVGVGSVGVGANEVQNSNSNTGDVTGIKNIIFQHNNYVPQRTSCWYSVSGRRIQGQPTEKGLYIFNGKKVVIK